MAVLVVAMTGCAGAGVEPERTPAPSTAAAVGATPPSAPPERFTLTSPAFADNAPIPAEYSCHGRNVPPPLRWQNVPPGTGSLALVVDDPDAVGELYVHWVITGIPATTTEMGSGVLPQGAVVSLNSGGEPEYLGPCPPAGTGVHHYRFQLYSLGTLLTVASTTPASEATRTIADAAFPAPNAVARTVGLFSWPARAGS